MNPTPENETPLTDAVILEKITCTSGGDEEWTVYPADEIVDADFARELERDRKRLRDAFYLAHADLVLSGLFRQAEIAGSAIDASLALDAKLSKETT